MPMVPVLDPHGIQVPALYAKHKDWYRSQQAHNS